MNREFDVIVVGAGPVGNFFASKVAEAGFKVAVLEKDREIGVPVRCGEGVGIGGLKMALGGYFDDRWVSYELNSATIYSPSLYQVKLDLGDNYALILDRKIFDKALGFIAMDNGGVFFLKYYVKNLILDDNGRVVGVKAITMTGEKELYARLIVAADGVESKVARDYGIDTSLPLNDIEICAQYFVYNIDIKEPSAIFYVNKEYAPGGYVWVFPKSKNTANIGLGIIGTEAVKYSPKVLLDSFMEKFYPQAKVLNFITGAVPVARRAPKLVKNNFMIIGDAARQVNPISGGGITYGLNAAKIAAEVAIEALKANDLSESKLKLYEKRWDSTIGKSQNKAYKLKEAIMDIKEEEYDRAAKKLQKEDKITYAKIFKTLFFTKPKLIFSVINSLFS